MNEKIVAENKMGVMPEGKLLINMSLPMMISMLVQAMYNIVDSLFVAHFHEDALTATSLAFPMQTIMIAIGAGTGVGVNALISRALGQKNQKRVNEVAMNGIFIFLLSYVVVALIGIFGSAPFYNFCTKPGQEQISDFGVQYLTIVMAGSFGAFMQFVFERILQSTGRTFLTMISQSTGAITNIILDPILIFGYFGMPRLGVAGAALATIIGQLFAAILAVIFNLIYNQDVQLSFKHFKPNFRIIGEIYVIGIPSIAMQSIGSVMVTGMNKILNGFSGGDVAVSVFGIYFKMQSFFFMPVFGLNNGLIPIVSYNYGAGNKKRMINTLKYGYVIAFGFMLLGFVAFMAIPDKLLLAFNAKEQMLSIGVPALRIISVHFLVAWYCIVTGSVFQALGKAVYSLYVSLARQLVVLLPAAYVLAKIGGLSMVWWSFPIAEIMSMVMSTICLKSVYEKVIKKI